MTGRRCIKPALTSTRANIADCIACWCAAIARIEEVKNAPGLMAVRGRELVEQSLTAGNLPADGRRSIWFESFRGASDGTCQARTGAMQQRHWWCTCHASEPDWTQLAVEPLEYVAILEAGQYARCLRYHSFTAIRPLRKVITSRFDLVAIWARRSKHLPRNAVARDEMPRGIPASVRQWI